MAFMKNFSLVLVALTFAHSSFASTIAIIDSGSDYRHTALSAQYELNPRPSALPPYINDVYGWNFAENNNTVIDYKYLEVLKLVMPDIQKFFVLQVRSLDKTATPADIAWLKLKRNDDEFIKKIGIFGNFAHGTHVAGITGGHSTKVDPDNHPFAVKIIPTEVKLPFSVQFTKTEQFRAISNPVSKFSMGVGLRETLFVSALRGLASFQTKIFSKVGAYVNMRGADVANGSFGTGYSQLKGVVEMLYNMVFSESERSPVKLAQFTKDYMSLIIMKSRVMVDSAPHTLFVFAAGNEGTNNDVEPVSPANIRAENSMVVAATLRNRELAVFSNYGLMVDVAAPGVGISSLYPGNERGLMSGTSQASPYVAGVAGTMKNINPGLKPIELKSILMDTVDAKKWLVNKVKSGGVVNPERAYEAARLTNQGMTPFMASVAARKRVADVPTEAPSVKAPPSMDDIYGIMPLISPVN
ncbi:MAG: S8 family serine peptidase [Cryobacterium sp.]|nr:S8 family serine peptidase [Oligoflexia bacterium]